MSLLEEIAFDIPEDARSRGASYFNQGRVKLVSARGGKIVARVQGQESYKVQIRVSENDLRLQCTCPYWQDYGGCKHIWATTLKAEDEGILDELDAILDEDYDEDDSDADDSDEADDDEDYEGDLSMVLNALVPPSLRGAMSRFVPSVAKTKGQKDSAAAWKQQLASLRNMVGTPGLSAPAATPPLEGRRLIYVIGPQPYSYNDGQLSVELSSQVTKPGGWGPPRGFKLRHSQIALLPDEQDRLIVQMLAGVCPQYDSSADRMVPVSHTLRAAEFPLLLRRICDTGRCFVRADTNHRDNILPVSWDDGPVWEFTLECRLSPGEAFYLIAPMLVRGEQRMSCREPLLALSGGIIVTSTHVARLEHFNAFPMLQSFRQYQPDLKIARKDVDQALESLFQIDPLPRLELPKELSVQTASPPMTPRLKISPPTKTAYYDSDRLSGELAFDYAGRIIPEGSSSSPFDPATRTLLRRDAAAESAAMAKLDELKFKLQYDFGGRSQVRRLTPSKLNKVVLHLCAAGWSVEAQGKLYRRAGEFKMEVSSGIDWFDLNGSMDFEGVSATLPKLLAAIKRGETTVQLDDGTIGILPDEWLKKYGLLARMAGKGDQDEVRFTRGQIGLLDALLSEMPQVSYDEMFEKARQQIVRFEGIEPMDPSSGFTGTLRPYQREGLGWLNFLNRFGLGGCLADDMGLGKTIQVLSLLHTRKGSGKPSLVVVPRSLIFNWIEEAKRFAPDLRVLDHSGIGRRKEFEHFRQYDIVLTTYGTLRMDAPLMKDVRFDYAILDEAQAIKNGSSESAKAARLIRADHRLAMSGTPVQNHLGELWSLFEFLNPGMLGAASVFKVTGKGNGIEREGREVLARALRPFILRRTKEQVARDLPEKTEQTIHCDMEPDQRKVYDELREHYRASLLNRVATQGIKKSKIQILEALLRLRQAACHPGLIDKTWIDKPAAKLDAMIPQIIEVIDENHKVLVFSQFTSMLAIVKKHLDKRKIVYEYLDGQTKDRQARVDRFQTDAGCKVFLISLKAGGLGLNLTAAEYVFLLDPWWNPAIEAQAIDRAHRIGQTRRVFAYRFIANDTVEQKVLELQARKKDLADMIINADNSLIGQLGKEDLELLLS